MKLSGKQVPMFWRLWKRVCVANRWNAAHGMNSAAVTAKRMELLARCGFDSLTEVDPLEGFSRVKRELLKLDDQLQGPREEIQPTIETGRKGRWFIENDLFPCIALYADVDAVLADLAADYKFCWKMDLQRGERIVLDDLSDDPVIKLVRGEPREFKSQLRQLLEALSAILNGKGGLRATAGDSVREMRLKAGLDRDEVSEPEREEVLDPANCPF